MAISKLPRVNSLFKTTLAQGISSVATEMTLQAVPTGSIDYPNWMVIEPDSANAEIVYLPTGPTGNTYSGIVRAISRTADADTAGTGIGHPANVDVLLAPTHRHLNDIVLALKGTNGTGSNDFRIGDELDTDKTIYAQNADGSKPFVRYDAAKNKWLISNDGVATFDITAGGSGLTRRLGVDIQASSILLDVRTSGGLRNNQGTGSQQADVDPTIVARLDTANTYSAAQIYSAAVTYNNVVTVAAGFGTIYVPTPTDPGMAVNKVYVDGTGTSGEAITVGQPLYIKESDGKLYRTDANLSDEATFNFVGFALNTVGAADLVVYFATPGRIVNGLSSLTAGAYYFLSDTVGTISTTPGTRYARIAQAISTTSIRVIEPRFMASGTITLNADGAFVATTGFRAANVRFYLGNNSSTTGGGSVGESICPATPVEGGVSLDLQGTTTVSRPIGAYSIRNANSGTTYSSGGITAVSNTGFTITNSSYNFQTVTLRWFAFN